MENLAHAIHQLQSGALSRPEFFARLERVLAAADSPGRLLEVLSEEHARAPLQDEVYAEVQRRIAQVAVSGRQAGADDTFVRTGPGAPAVPGEGPQPGTEEGPFGPEPERVKAVGDTLNGRFVLEECIGFGGMGTVYKALDLRKLEAADRQPYIAIKVLNVQFRGHPKSLIALQREARKAQALAHPNIVAVYDFDRDGAMVYLTMEYLSGKPLSQVLRAPGFTGMPYAQAMPIVTGMANALAYAHQRGFVHCDFKPGNVILTDSGNVKVIDFGIARVFQKAEEDVDVTVFDPGSLGALTPAYASPEMQERREPDPRDDIYALACITYELLTGHHPFNRLSSLQARAAGMRPQRPANLGRRQWRGLKCALAFEREARTPTVARFLLQVGQSGAARRYAVPLGVGAGIAAAAVLAVLGARALRSGADGQQQAAPPAAVVQAARRPAAAPAAPAVLPAPDAVAAALAAIPCSALVASVRGHALAVHGYLSKELGPAHLQDRLAALPGVAAVNLEVQQVEADKCPVISAFAPYWVAHRRAGGGAAIRLAAPNGGPGAVLTEGDLLMVDVTTAAVQSYVTVDYYALDGGVVHLLPNTLARANLAPAHYTATIGGLGNWVIAKPFGAELLVLLTTPVPLFDTLRPPSEAGADYLAAVARQLGQIGARDGGDKIGVDFLQIRTRPRAP